MMFDCVIVEDLPVAAEYLTKCCEKSGLFKVAAQFSNIKAAASYLNEHSTDVLFLDVEMPEGSGFELLDQLSYFPKVILTTSKPEYAYDAFEYNVVDFLKKPFSYQRFLDAVHKIDPSPAVATPESDHMFIKTEGKLIRLGIQEVLFIESMGDYVRFVTLDKKYVTHNTIKNIEEKVSKSHFIRAHRSYIINFSLIDDIRENFVYIKGHEIPISKSQKPEILKKLNIL